MRSFHLISLSLLVLCLLPGCQSEAARDRDNKETAEHKFEEDDQQRQDTMVHSEAVRAIEIQKQNQLDAVEQKRTGDVYAHSCRRAVGIDPAMPVSVDTKNCTPEQLKLELEAERRQMFDDAMKKAKQN